MEFILINSKNTSYKKQKLKSNGMLPTKSWPVCNKIGWKKLGTLYQLSSHQIDLTLVLNQREYIKVLLY